MPAYDADEAAADAARAAKEQALMYQQVSHLADRKVAAEQAHGDYLRAHPALGPLLADLTRAVLLAKPPSIFALAARHFAAVGERGGAKPPTLARGPPPLVVCGAAQARIFDLVSRRFPKLFRAPLVTTSRPPRRGERPGVTCDFTTAAMLARDAAAGKYFEHGADEHGAAAGTTLEAVAAVRALGLVPLLHLPAARAAAAMACAAVAPRPFAVLVCDCDEATPGAGQAFDLIIEAAPTADIIEAIVEAVRNRYADALVQAH